ncbi:Uncharacterised protein [Mycobacteroides abscessus]|nr:Uncharacterised protein [Mycobacteroides abscessus]SKG44878.1 Uncharacterised protein [Mycobacteroides abscessus subsp. abscessus]SKY37764.1 Uncharacterised protein [Mycobacteroides abscessus subsp. abscessus]
MTCCMTCMPLSSILLGSWPSLNWPGPTVPAMSMAGPIKPEEKGLLEKSG